MSRLRFNIPTYDKAEYDFIDEVILGFRSHDPLLHRIPITTTRHSGPTRNVRSPRILDQPMQSVQQTMSLDLDAIRKTEIEKFTSALYEFAKSINEAEARSFFKGINEITDAIDHSIDAQGKLFSFDMVNDVLERTEIEFDEHGEPILPTMIVPPAIAEKMKETPVTPEQEQRKAEIIARKKAEFYAKKRTRRLSR